MDRKELRKRWIMGTIQPELFYIPWKVEKEQKKILIQIYPRTQVNRYYSAYYPVADINYRKISNSKYMILNENHICLNTDGEIAEDSFVSQGVQVYKLSSGKYYYYEIVAAEGDMLIEEPIEFIVADDTENYTEYYFEHDYRAIKIYYECATVDMPPNIEVITDRIYDTSPEYNYSVIDNTKIMPPTISYIIYTKIKSIEFKGKDYTHILQEVEPSKDPYSTEGDYQVVFSGVDPNSGWYLLGTTYFLYEVHPKYLISGYKFENTEAGITYKFYPNDAKHSYNTGRWKWSSYRSQGGFAQIDCVREYCSYGDEGFPTRKSIEINKPPFADFIKTTYKNGFEFKIEKHLLEHQVTDMLFSISEDGSISKIEDNSNIREEEVYPEFDFTFRGSKGINKNTTFNRLLAYEILQRYVNTDFFVRIYEKNQKEYQTSVLSDNGGYFAEYLSGVSDEEIQDCFDIIIVNTRQAREGYEEYLDG